MLRRIPALVLFLLPAAAAPSQSGTAAALESARAAYDAGQFTRVVELLRAAAAANPQEPEIQLLLAKSYMELSEFDAAIQSAERAVHLTPKNSVYHEWLGRVYGEKADRASMFSAFSLAKKARKELEIAVQLDKRNFSARQNLIEFYCSAPGIIGGGEDKALPHIARLAELDEAEGHYARGNCRRQKKDFAAAGAEFSKTLAASPRSADLIYDIGDYALKQSQPAQLLAVAEAGQRANPADPRGSFYRATALVLQKSRSPEAVQLLRGYLARATLRNGYPTPAAAREWLGRALELQGDLPGAVREYQAALQADPKNKAARDALKRLGKN